MDIHTEHCIAYIEGRLSREDTLRFEEQLRHSPELQKEVDDLRFIYDASNQLYQQEQIDVDKRWNKVSRTLKVRRYRLLLMTFARRAAAVLFIPILLSTLYFYQKNEAWKNMSVEQIELSSAYGIISKITLSDGSEIWLNSGSKLHYPKKFIGKARKVYLSGEGYFKVSSDKNHRFDVELSNGLTVSAYGTEFNVNSYESDESIQMTLAEGSVEIKNRKELTSYALQPGMQAVFSKATKKVAVSKANLYMATSWKEGKIVFRRTPMKEIAQRLSRHFNVNIVLKNKEIFDYKYSATFKEETLEDILKLLEKTTPIKCTLIEPEQETDYSYTQKTVIIERL